MPKEFKQLTEKQWEDKWDQVKALLTEMGATLQLIPPKNFPGAQIEVNCSEGDPKKKGYKHAWIKVSIYADWAENLLKNIMSKKKDGIFMMIRVPSPKE